ncbi:hypothetical protein CAOG_009900 [Capsaspora owczarzaki ATCC 30864]|uniref:Uncharacterized protein n=1 Tax=Capsaspora owczarzaki (strain ATCC 30864) TaxID=595528 RepID=A0A0D2UJI9_CAPO3|nr:hypothetical protein CAOG_009900 [Capsaspora owczarzaki ATCC 30864]
MYRLSFSRGEVEMLLRATLEISWMATSCETDCTNEGDPDADGVLEVEASASEERDEDLLRVRTGVMTAESITGGVFCRSRDGSGAVGVESVSSRSSSSSDAGGVGFSIHDL